MRLDIARASTEKVATPHRRAKIFSVFTRDRRTLRRPDLGSPSIPRETPLKGGRKSRRELKIPRRCLLSPRCASPSLFLPAVVLSSSSFLLSSLFLPFLHPLSLPELSTRGRRKTHNSDSPSLSSFSLTLSLPLRLSRSSRSTSEPAIRSLVSLVFSRDNGSLFFVGSAR